jgi:hypothetical protein
MVCIGNNDKSNSSLPPLQMVTPHPIGELPGFSIEYFNTELANGTQDQPILIIFEEPRVCIHRRGGRAVCVEHVDAYRDAMTS